MFLKYVKNLLTCLEQKYVEKHWPKHGFSSPSFMIDILFHPHLHQKKNFVNFSHSCLSTYFHCFVMTWICFCNIIHLCGDEKKAEEWRIVVVCEKQTQNKELKQVLGLEAANMNFFWVLNMFFFSIVIFSFLFMKRRKFI